MRLQTENPSQYCMTLALGGALNSKSTKSIIEKCNVNIIQKLGQSIRKTCPCNVYPLESHFYIVKMGFAMLYLFFLFLILNIHFGYLLEPPRIYNQCFEQNIKNIDFFQIEIFVIFEGAKLLYFACVRFCNAQSITG